MGQNYDPGLNRYRKILLVPRQSIRFNESNLNRVLFEYFQKEERFKLFQKAVQYQTDLMIHVSFYFMFYLC